MNISHSGGVFWLLLGLWFKALLSDPEGTSSLRFGGSCTPFRPSLPWCFPIWQMCFGSVWLRFKASLSDPEGTFGFQFGGSCTPFGPSLPCCFPIQQVCFGCSLGYDTKLLCRIQKGRLASGLVDLARLSVLHCHRVFPSGRCVLGCNFWGVNIWPWFGALLPVRESVNIPIPTAGSRAWSSETIILKPEKL